MTIKLIAIDMDATLLRHDKTYDIPRFKKLLATLSERGIKVCIATGNSIQKLHSYFDDETRMQLYFAGDNGNQISKGDEVLRNLEIMPNDYQQVIEFLNQSSGFYPAVCTGYETYIAADLPTHIEEYIRQYNPNLLAESNLLTAELAHPPIKIAIASEHSLEDNKTMMQAMNTQFPAVRTVTSGEIWLDVYHRDGGKGSAIQFLQERYHISPSETMAFGDSLNDETMMLTVEYSVAMGNADADLARLCRYQIGTNEEQAVLDTLEQLVATDNLDFIEKYAIQYI
ncbi:Cof-type HAD-IIB family hydrolase [Aerococcaceae bacterium NML210727]|nr:Cof-type HAD-IIB family hydrolase [Aerococcaceae bacterium NML210727]MCW6655020.1 Cof-type HAD-IIB family hydrolase [Aerococcaceae bacterium NML201296]